MGTLAELKKRIKLGTGLYKISGHKGTGIGKFRYVDRVQTNGFYIEGSWLPYPQRSNLCEYDGYLFSFYFPKHGYVYNEKGRLVPKSDERGDLIGLYRIEVEGVDD